jgi:alpha-tubulin suppressor-like RCC1 family protein
MKLFKKYTIVVGLFLMSTTIFSQCFTKVNAGYGHVVAKKPNGSLWCWGWGSWGQLNNGSGGLNESLPISFSSSLDWENVFAGKFATFAIKTNGTLWGCGGNSFGGLGINSTIENIYNLSQIGVANNWKEMSANDYFTIGLRTDGTIWGTGQNDGYQMGNATCCANQLSFMQIGTATDWKTIGTSASRAAFGLKYNGTLWGWGTNFGLLGYSNVSVLQVPTQLTTDTDWDKMSIGASHGLLLKTNGTLWSWGGNQNGERALDPGVDIGGFDNNQIPGNWTEISAGFRMSFGIKTDGTLWGWGLNSFGQLGNGTTTDTYVPTQVGTATNWQSISSNYRYAVALRTDGSLWSWGNNSQGQLGTGSTIASSTPTQVAVAGCSLGTDEFVTDATQLIVSPNPAVADLNLRYKGQATVDTIVIYDLTGREVYRIAALGSASFQSSFNIGFLQSGSYIVSLKNASGDVASKQFLKN